VFFLREENADLDSASGWSYLSHEIVPSGSDATLRLTLQHPAIPIRVHAHFHTWVDAPIVRCWMEYENVDSSARILQAQSFCNLVLKPIGALEAVWVAPFTWDWRYTDDNFTVHREALTNNQQRQLVIGPYAASDKNPGDPNQRLSCGWFVLHQPQIPAGLFCGVEWSGACDARVSVNNAGQGQISIEHRRAVFQHQVEPGERIASPAAFIGLFEGSLDEATHLTRTLAVSHYIRARPSIRAPFGAEVSYVMANTWGYASEIEEVGLRAYIDRAAAIGVEIVTIDEGWEARLGDWWSHPTRFPSGLRATTDRIHNHGMGAGLWLAYGVADPLSQVAKAHPDWLATWGGVPVSAEFNSVALCLSHPPVLDWVAAEFDRIITEYDIDVIVQDFVTIARCDNPAHAHQAGDSEYRNVLALWELLDGVRARHPNVWLDNNWSGGRVLDFGMLRHYDSSLCDDYNLAPRSRVASFGATHFLPPAFVLRYMDIDHQSIEYQTRSYFFGGPFNLMIRLLEWDAGVLADVVRDYKDLRRAIRDGRVYHLHAPALIGKEWEVNQVGWDAIQAVAIVAEQAVIFVGRGYGGAATFNVKPRGLDPNRVYSAASSTGADYGVRLGSDWMANGINVSLPEVAHETIVLSG